MLLKLGTLARPDTPALSPDPESAPSLGDKCVWNEANVHRVSLFRTIH